MLRLHKNREIALLAGLLWACNTKRPSPSPAPLETPGVAATAVQSARSNAAPAPPSKVEREANAMGTRLHFIAFTNERVDVAAAERAVDAAIIEMRRLEALLSEWQDTSEVGRLNQRAGDWVEVGPETLHVLQKGLWGGQISEGTFDITFQSMSGLWKFGSASEKTPRVPSREAVARAQKLIDYRKVELDPSARRARIPKGHAVGLGGIAKGYIVDRAAAVLTRAGLRSFLVQAGGDLYGAGRKPDGSPWVSGIQDPRGPQGQFFATLELEDHAFSTAGDYARSFVVEGKRYHHIIDPRTGYPATLSRSVTVWAKDALTADIVDDAIFILGPKKGLDLAESLDGVGVVIVDANNRVWTSRRLEGRVHLLRPPTDGL